MITKHFTNLLVKLPSSDIYRIPWNVVRSEKSFRDCFKGIGKIILTRFAASDFYFSKCFQTQYLVLLMQKKIRCIYKCVQI